MRVKNAVNIGKPDAVRLGLDRTLAGETNDVKKEAADEMLANGWAVDPRSEETAAEATPAAPLTLKDQPRGK